MPYYHISGAPSQYQKLDGTLASGYYLKFYAKGTTTPISMYSALSGSGALAKCALNTGGYPVNGSSAVFIPVIDQKYKLVLYKNSTDADANTFANAEWEIDELSPLGFGQSTTVDTLDDLKGLDTSVYTDAETNGYYELGDGGHARYGFNSGSSATPDDFLVVQPDTGGGRWELLLDGNTVNARLAGIIGDESDETSRFNALIAGINSQNLLAYLPDPVDDYYKTTSTLTTITTGLGIIGNSEGSTLIQHYATTDCIVAKGSYKFFKNLRLSNQSASGAGTSGHAMLHIKNSAYSRVENVYTDHDLDDYSGVLLEHEYTGSDDDAYFIAHLGCWYNIFVNVTALYKTFGVEKGYGVHYKVNSNATSVVNPPNQTAGTYNGSVSNNTFIGPNIEGKLHGLRLDGADNNVFISGQFLGNSIQVRGINARQNTFIGTKHNQWTSEPFNFSGTSGRNMIDTPTLYSTGSTPWSLGTLTSTDLVRHAGEGMEDDQYFPVKVRSEIIKAGPSATPYLEIEGTNNDVGKQLIRLGYTSNAVSVSTYHETTKALVTALLNIGNGTSGNAYLAPAVTNVTSLGLVSKLFKDVFSNAYYIGTAKITSGTGTPEGAVTGNVGDMFLRTNGGAGTTFYVKESGTGNTGWIGK